MKRKIEVFDYANEILKGVSTGVLLTTKVGDKVNSMTISWGTLGIEWNRTIFTTFVRENRFTKGLLDQNQEFTISVPYGSFDKKILGVCGTQSGRDVDKIAALGLTLVEPDQTSVPGILQLPLTLECRVVYKQRQDLTAIAEKDRASFYPQDVDGSFHGANRDAHTAYYGEIVSAYIIEP